MLYVKARLDLVAAKGKGWIDYIEINPADKKAEPKTSYVEGIEDLVVSCGIYKK